MANIRRWIAEARDLEEAGDLQGALAIYRKALVAQEETSGFADLSLYNGLGDLFLRAGDLHEAIEAYENAAAQCEEQQLYANGIALCKKILRNAPDYTPVYRRVGRLFALSGLDAEASANYLDYARRTREAGRDDLALEGLHEMIGLTADEAAAVDLADELADRGEVNEALTMLRSARERRERQGRDFVMLLRKIQELQPRGTEPVESDAPVSARTVAVPQARPATSAEESSSPSFPTVREPAPGTAPAPATEVAPSPTQPEGSTPPYDPSFSFDTADTGSLTRELQRVLSDCDGDDRFRYALPIIDHLLELQPGRFELLHRKLAYAFALGEEGAAVSAYLALGECLDRQLRSFTLRTLSTSTSSGDVTAAVKVESIDASPGSQGGG